MVTDRNTIHGRGQSCVNFTVTKITKTDDDFCKRLPWDPLVLIVVDDEML